MKMNSAVAMLLALLAIDAVADDDRSLAEIVVVGTRSDSLIFELPYSVHRVDEALIRSDLYRTLPQALSRIPGVMVQETSPGQGSPFIRGFTGFRNLFLIDGVRLNNSVMRDGPNQYWATVDLHSLGRLEVLSGSAGALYGTDALGGTVNAVSRDIRGTGTDVFLRLASAEESATLRLQHDQRFSDDLALSVGVTGKTFGDLEGGREVGRQTNVGYDELGFDIKAKLRLSERWEASFLHQQVSQSDVPRTHKTTAAVSWRGTTVGSELVRDLDQDRRLTYVRLNGDNPWNWADSAIFTLSNAYTGESRFRVRSGDRRDTQGFDVDTYGAALQFVSSSAIGRLTYGVEFYRDRVDSFSSRNPVQGPVGDDATYELFDVFVQDEIAVGDRTDVIIGLRRTQTSARADSVLEPTTQAVISIDEDFSKTVGNLRLQHRLRGGRFSVFAGISQGFRAPNLSDLTRFDTARTDEFETPSPGLQPEKFLSHDLGIKWNFDSSFGSATLFYTDVDDLIIRFPTGRFVDGDAEITKENAGDGYVHGVELYGGINISAAWSLTGSVTLMDGEVSTFPTSDADLVDEPLDRLMPFTLRTQLRYDAPAQRWWAEAEVVHASEADHLSTRDRSDTSRIPPGGTPEFTVVHLRGGWQFAGGMRVVTAVNNIINDDYRVHGSGTNMPGRNVIVSLESRF